MVCIYPLYSRYSITRKKKVNQSTRLERFKYINFGSWSSVTMGNMVKKGTRLIEQQNRAKDIGIIKANLSGESKYADLQRQSIFGDHTLALC